MAEILWSIQWWQLSALTTALPLAKELRDRGHKVTFLSTPVAREALASFGFAFRDNRHVPAYDWSRKAHMPAPLTDIGDLRHLQWVIQQLPLRIREVYDALNEHPYKLVITDGKLVGSGLGAEMAGIPWVSYVDFYFGKHSATPISWLHHWNMLRQRHGLGDDPRPSTEAKWLAFSPHLTLLFGIPALMDWRETWPQYVHHLGPIVSDPPSTQDMPWLVVPGVNS